VAPGVARETTVGHGRVGMQALVPQLGGVLEVLLLQLQQLVGRKCQLGQLRASGGTAHVQTLEGLQGFRPAVAKKLLELLDAPGPVCFRIHLVS
jgi:hypothetical protein